MILAIGALLLTIPESRSTAATPGVPRHEIHAHFLRFGMGAMPVASQEAYSYATLGNWSAGMGIGYTYWMTRHIGLSTGADIAYMFYNERYKDIASSSQGSVFISDGTNTTMHSATMAVHTNQAHEAKTFTMIEIPLMLSFKARHLYLNAGMAAATSLTSFGSYAYSPSTYQLSEIEDLGIRLEGIPTRTMNANGGNGTYTPTDVKHPFFAMVTAEIGWLFPFDERNMVSISLYGSYALNSFKSNLASAEVVDVVNGTARRLSLMQAGIASEYRYYAAGFCIAYHFGFGKSTR